MDVLELDPRSVILKANPAFEMTMLQFGHPPGVDLLDQLAVDPGRDHVAFGPDDDVIPLVAAIVPIDRFDVAINGHERLIVMLFVPWAVFDLQFHAVAAGPT